MPLFRAKQQGYLGATRGLVEEGQVFEWDGPVGKWMEPVTDGSKTRKPKAPSLEMLYAKPVRAVDMTEGLKPVRSASDVAVDNIVEDNKREDEAKKQSNEKPSLADQTVG